MHKLSTSIVFAAVVLATVSAGKAAGAEKPIVIAHRGASGYLPEHTLEAYAMAYALGADYIEPDLVLTKDGVFVCMHDIQLEDTTDVEQKFPGRKRADGHWYAADFTLAEIKQLSAHERLPNRFPQDASHFAVPTFEEMIELIQGLNSVTGKTVGIYPELKQPHWHEEQGLPMEEALLNVLARHGYTGKAAPVYIQCFEPQALQKIRFDLHSELPLILLVGGGRASENILSPDGLKALAAYANGIGPDKKWIERNPKIVKWAHENGLVVHPYTFRADDYPKQRYGSFEHELRTYIQDDNIDGFFTDQADIAAAVVDDVANHGKRRHSGR